MSTFSYFYDDQVRRYLLQFMRIFSLIKIRSAPDENGAVSESTVPVYYGDMSRMVAHILRKNSENTAPPTNVMSVHIASIKPLKELRRDPMWVGKINIDERKFDKETQSYTGDVGNQYSIERYMPSPYMLTMNLDIWTINTETKLQILEQIWTIFNPSVQIQQHENMLDWSIFTEITLEDVQWSSRTIPQGTDVERDVATLTFNMPIQINPPAKVKRKALIEQIVTNVYDVAEMPSELVNKKFELDSIKSCFDALGQIIITPGNHNVKIGIDGAGDAELILLDAYGNEDPTNSWEDLITQYGEYQNETSSITLKSNDDIESNEGDVSGFFEFRTDRSDAVGFTIDVDTLPSIIASGPITQIIDPTQSYPGDGILPAAAIGQRYLLTEDIPDNTGLNPWGSVGAREQDIIEYNGTAWFVSFDSSNQGSNQYVSIAGSPTQHYRFNGQEWSHTYFGKYCPGYWRIKLQEC